MESCTVGELKEFLKDIPDWATIKIEGKYQHFQITALKQNTETKNILIEPYSQLTIWM